MPFRHDHRLSPRNRPICRRSAAIVRLEIPMRQPAPVEVDTDPPVAPAVAAPAVAGLELPW